MDRGAWRATAHEVAVLDPTERLSTATHTHTQKARYINTRYSSYEYNFRKSPRMPF